jgi:hypothetical protein
VDLPAKFRDFPWFAERFFTIRDRHGTLIPFKLNALQQALYSDLCGQDDVLKARQGGCSTLVVLRMLHEALTRPNFRGVILAHEYRSALELIDIARIGYNHLPDQLKPRLSRDTVKELRFAVLDSRITAATARNPDIGRGGSINALHCSEIAAWDNPASTLAAIGPSLGPDCWTVRESTAKGAGTYWHREWIKSKNGQSGYQPHFFDWRIEPEYAVLEPDPLMDPAEFGEEGDRLELILSERERELELTVPQARWRRRQVAKYGALYPQEYAEDDVTCFLVTGRSVFDNQAIQRRFEGLLSNLQIVSQDDRLGLTVFHEFEKKFRPYLEFVIGADPSEGVADPTDPQVAGDACAATILEKRSGIQVASVHGSWEAYEFAHVLKEVASRFTSLHGGQPLLAVERNGPGAAVLSELHKHIQYPRLYWHEAFDQRRHRLERRVGWHTNSSTRPIMIDALVKAVEQSHLKILDPQFYAECLTFVRTPKGRPEAQPGCHDDRLMATAIAWQMRQQYVGAPLIGTNLP